jgi:hypothetical protein
MLVRAILAALLASGVAAAADEEIPAALHIPPVAVAEILKGCPVAVQRFELHETASECIRRAALAYPGIAAEMGSEEPYKPSDCHEPAFHFTYDEMGRCLAGTLKETVWEQRNEAHHAICAPIAEKNIYDQGQQTEEQRQQTFREWYRCLVELEEPSTR